MAWYFGAVKAQIPVNFSKGGMIKPLHGIVLHIMEGGEAGTRSWFRMTVTERQKVFDDMWEKGGQKGKKLTAYASSAHFGNPRTGPMEQFVDTDNQAWAQGTGNPEWVSVENEGFSGDSLTQGQMDNLARLLVWLHKTEQVPLQLADNPAGFGIGSHSMGGAAWGNHLKCPGEPILAQRDKIIAIANDVSKLWDTPPDVISGAG